MIYTATSKDAYPTGTSVLDGSSDVWRPNLFGGADRLRLCLLDRNPLSGRQAFFCCPACRSEWHRIYNEAKAEDTRRSRVPTALEFAEQNTDMVYWIGTAILDDMRANRRATFRYYFEAYRRHISGRAVMLNNNWQATFRELVVNQFPETAGYLKVRAKG